jgi:hypothetical protein
VHPLIISNRYGSLEPQLTNSADKENSSEYLFDMACPSLAINGKWVESDGCLLEWLFIRAKEPDTILLKSNDYPYSLICMLQNSMQIHITGDGQMELHERGIQLLYSPFMSYSINLEQEAAYVLCTIHYTQHQFETEPDVSHYNIVQTDYLQPRFLFPKTVIMKRNTQGSAV